MTERCAYVDPRTGEKCGRDERHAVHHLAVLDAVALANLYHPFQSEPLVEREVGPLGTCAWTGHACPHLRDDFCVDWKPEAVASGRGSICDKCDYPIKWCKCPVVKGALWLTYHGAKSSQWENMKGEEHVCPYCGQDKEAGHHKDCMIGNGLRAMEELVRAGESDAPKEPERLVEPEVGPRVWWLNQQLFCDQTLSNGTVVHWKAAFIAHAPFVRWEECGTVEPEVGPLQRVINNRRPILTGCVYLMRNGKPCGQPESVHHAGHGFTTPVETVAPDSAEMMKLECGHGKWDSRQDCLVCLRYAVQCLNDTISKLRIERTQVTSDPKGEPPRTQYEVLNDFDNPGLGGCTRRLCGVLIHDFHCTLPTDHDGSHMWTRGAESAHNKVSYPEKPVR